MKALLFSDLHLSDKPPSSATDSYLDDLFDLLYQITVLSKDVDVVVCAGDCFHNKNPRNNSHRLVQRAIEWTQSLSCPFYIVPGNHDILNDALTSVMESQPLGVLFRADAAKLLNGWAEDTSLPLYGVPWLQSFTNETVKEAFCEYREVFTLKNTLVVTHAPLYPPGKELPFENYPTVDWAAAMGNRGYTWYGHVHEPHGVYKVDGVTFANFGALSRGSLHEYNLTRDVCVGMWDSESGEFERIVLGYKSADQVFKLTEKMEQVDKKKKFEEFLSTISYATVEITSIESVLAYIREMDLGEDFNTLATELLEEAQNR